MAPLGRLIALALCFSVSSVSAVEHRGGANPIRKVVNMMQNMQKKVIAEGEKEKELYDKFMCYCKTAGSELTDSIAKAEDKLDTLPTEIEETKDKLKSSKESLKKAEVDRATAKATIAEATGIREKESKAFTDMKAETEANMGAMNKAIAAMEAGMEKSFLQTGAAQVLKKMVSDSQDMDAQDRESLSSFLSQKSAGPSAGIVGVLKTMNDEMTKELADATKLETGAQKDFDGLIAAKTKEIDALTKGIEKKIKEIGDMGVEVTQMEADLDDTTKGLEDDKATSKDLGKSCGTKTKEWEKRSAARQEELVALGDTIKMLNDDDALELFKKTLPAPSASLLQVQVTTRAMKEMALQKIHAARRHSHGHQVQIDLMAMALRGKKVDFAKVIGMIDNMMGLLKKEQAEDDEKKAYCEAEFDQAEDTKKALEKKEKDATDFLNTAKKAMETMTEEVGNLEVGVKKLDKEVADATAMRKQENTEFKDLVASDTAAKELLLFAKNRLNKFYNPSQYKPPAKKELSAEERVAENFKFVQVTMHSQAESFGTYRKETEASTGVIAMIDILVAEMDKEVTEAEAEEANAQKDYETFIADSKEKRRADTKAMEDKLKVKADMEVEMEEQAEIKKDVVKELYGVLKYLDSLHKECDFLMDFYEVRKQARDTEIKSMTDAKAVLSGADFSFIQRSHGHLRRQR